MITGNILEAIGHELQLLPRVIRGLRTRGHSWASTLRFLIGRVTCPEKPGANHKPFITPCGLHLRNRREMILYQALFVLDEYRTDLWGEEFRRQDHPVVLDVGANMGFFAALCLQLCPSARVHSFEIIPEFEPFIRYRQEEGGGLEQGGVHMAAVGAEDLPEITIHYDNPLSSTNRIDQAQGSHEARISQVALDSWVKRNRENLGAFPWLVKLDVEGAETEIVKGAGDVLARAHTILMELHECHDLLEFFRGTHEVLFDFQNTPETWIVVLRRKDRLEPHETLRHRTRA